MANDPRLERYLTSLEAALKPFPVSDRAEIITEIKSHVMEALDRDSNTSVDSVLGAIGEPETVANRYLLERGMKPAKTSIHPIVKWLTIGFLGTLAMLLLFAGFVLTRFNSLVSVNEKDGHVQIFNGLIDVQADENRVQIRGTTREDFEGSAEKTGDAFRVTFGKGQFAIETTQGERLLWVCADNDPQVDASLSFKSSRHLDCVLKVPEKANFEIKGDNGQVRFKSPRFNAKASLENGRITFKPDNQADYKFKNSASAGKVATLPSSDKPDAYQIELHVGNGRISQED